MDCECAGAIGEVKPAGLARSVLHKVKEIVQRVMDKGAILRFGCGESYELEITQGLEAVAEAVAILSHRDDVQLAAACFDIEEKEEFVEPAEALFFEFIWESCKDIGGEDRGAIDITAPPEVFIGEDFDGFAERVFQVIGDRVRVTV